ncbi:hypothetical protein TWF281_002929 [Arthrobotrys megalospora]
MSGFFEIPQEVWDTILQYIPGSDVKNLALVNSAVLNLVSPKLFRRLKLQLKDPRDKVVGIESTELPSPTLQANPRFDSEDIERILGMTPRSMSFVKELSVAFPPPPQPAGIFFNTDPTECFTKQDDYLLRLVLRKLAACGNVEIIAIPQDISAKTAHAILSSFLDLRSLKLGSIGTSNGFDTYEVGILEKATSPLRIESLELGLFMEHLVPAVLQTLRRCHSLRKLVIGPSSGPIMPFVFRHGPFSDGSIEGENRKKNDQTVSLPLLEDLSHDSRLPAIKKS